MHEIDLQAIIGSHGVHDDHRVDETPSAPLVLTSHLNVVDAFKDRKKGRDFRSDFSRGKFSGFDDVAAAGIERSFSSRVEKASQSQNRSLVVVVVGDFSTPVIDD